MSRRENWIKHDTRSRIDPKMSRFVKRFGMEGYGTFWALLEVLDYQDDHEFDIDIDAEGIADGLGLSVDRFLEILGGMLDGKDPLLARIGNRVCQSKMKQDKANEANRSKEISEVRSAAGRAGGIKSGLIRSEAKPEPVQEDGSKTKQNEANEARLDKKRVDNINTGATPNGGPVPDFASPIPPKKKTSDIISIAPADLVIPEQLNTPEAHAALRSWLQHKRSIKKPYRTTDAVQRLLNHWKKFGAAAFVTAVDESIRNVWQGLFDPKPAKAQAQTTANAEQIFPIVQKAITRFGARAPDDAIASLPENLRGVVRRAGWGELCRASQQQAVKLLAAALA